MKFGTAGNIRVKQFCGDGSVDKLANRWFRENPHLKVIDIKFDTSATNEDYASDILVIYKVEREDDLQIY